MGKRQSKTCKVLSEKFLQSYGIWTQMAQMINQSEFTRLQQLNRYMYRTGIQRVQMCVRLNNQVYFFWFRTNS